MKKALNISLWILLFSAFFALLSFTTISFKDKRCSEVYIHVDNAKGFPLVNEAFIENYLIDNSFRIRGQKMNDVPVDAIESKMTSLDHVRSAKVYADLKGDLHINLVQKQPIARVFNPNGSSFYMDELGVRMELSNLHSARVLAITSDKAIELSSSKNDDELTFQKQLFDLIEMIKNNEFWSSQIVQIHVNEQGEIELTPRVGNHNILIGKATDLSSKFDKLWNFYQALSKESNWSTYKVLNAKYKDQIVCTKK